MKPRVEALAEALLLAMDGDFLPEAGMGVDNAGQDVPLDKARPKEVAWWAARTLAALPTPCPRCNGAGIVDTSPPGVEAAPWLQTDIDCPRCGGGGEIDPTTYEPDIEESP